MSENELPDGWAWARLGDLGVWRGGGTPSKSRPDFWENGEIPWLSPKDMGAEVVTSTRDHITEAALEESAVHLVPAQSVAIVTRSGVLEHSVPIAITTFDTTLNQDMKAVTSFSGVSPKWLAWGLRALERHILSECRKSGTTVASLSTTKLMDLRFPLPPLAEQHRIVEALEVHLSSIASGRSGLHRARARVEHLATAFFGRAAAGGLSEPVAEGATASLDSIRAQSRSAASRKWKPTQAIQVPEFALPRNWQIASLGDLSYDSGYGTSTKCDYEATGTPVLRIPNIQKGDIDTCDLKYSVDPTLNLSSYYLKSGDVLFVRTNGSRSLIGRVGVVDEGMSFAFASYLIRFRLTPGLVEPRWVQLVMSSPSWRRTIENYAASSAGQYNLSINTLARLPVPLPPIETQKQTLATLNAADSVRGRLASAVVGATARADLLKRSLLTRAFTGRLVPQDPDDEPASVLLERIKAERAARPKAKRTRTTTGRAKTAAPPSPRQSVDGEQAPPTPPPAPAAPLPQGAEQLSFSEGTEDADQ